MSNHHPILATVTVKAGHFEEDVDINVEEVKVIKLLKADRKVTEVGPDLGLSVQHGKDIVNELRRKFHKRTTHGMLDECTGRGLHNLLPFFFSFIFFVEDCLDVFIPLMA